MNTITKTLTIVLEKGDDDELWGRIESPDFLLTTVGSNVVEITNDLREQLDDWIEHEGRDLTQWQGVKAEDIMFSYE